MPNMYDSKKASKALNNYFFLLEKVGYVKDVTVRKFLVYTFLLDFIEDVKEFITEDDFILIDRIMKRNFTNGGCLLPYPVACADRVELVSNNKRGEE